MAKDDKNVVYSETIDFEEKAKNNLEEENKAIRTSLNRLEEESAMLRELFTNTSNELNNLRKPALLVADVLSCKADKAVIKLPNGNKFYSYIHKDLADLRAGDCVLVDQKSLNIVEKIDLGLNLEVDKFVIVDKPKETWAHIGGLKKEIEEIKEVI